MTPSPALGCGHSRRESIFSRISRKGPDPVMKATIYHNPRCSTSRQTLDMLREAGADVTVIDYLKTPPSQRELQRLYARAGLTPAQGLRMKEDDAKALAG